MAGFTVAQIKALSAKDGMTADPGQKGLYLYVRGSGKYVSWVYRYRDGKKLRDKAIGTIERVTLKEARETASRYRLEGVAEKIEAPQASTFKQDATAYHAYKLGKWDSAYSVLWLQAMANHVFPKIGATDTAKITPDQIADVLRPLWDSQYPTAMRLHGQIKAIIEHAANKDDSDRFTARNPADKALLRLPSRKAPAQKPRLSICWKDAPALYKALAARDCQASKALRFLMLAGTPRAAEIFGAKWSEIDGDVWHVPADRMKSGTARDIPLTPAANSLLASLSNERDGFLFTGRKGKTVGAEKTVGRARVPVGGTFIEFAGHMHSDAMQILLREMGIDSCVHGLRATFKTWVQDNAQLITDWEASELCLDHSVANQVQRAYGRSDLINQRRELLNRWAAFLMG